MWVITERKAFMSNSKTVEPRLSKVKKKPKNLLEVLGWCLKVVRLLTLLFGAIDKLFSLAAKLF